ncbi:MAG: prenyltransferase [Candidatus Bathyarchaeia archaeon]
MATASKIFRLSRAQFLPVILSPVLVGTALAWWTNRIFNPLPFGLVVLGSISFHLAANTIDDVYDFESQVDVVSNRMFPPDFGGWKILPRGLMTFGQAKLTAYFFFMLTIIVGLFLTILTGPFVLLLGAVGLFFAYFHVAPPLRLGYRGLGLSELGIFLSFGILPVVGCFYVQSGYVSFLPALVGLPLGFLTTTILVNHDQIFFDAYKTGGKKSYTVTVGRKMAVATTFTLTLVSYAIIVGAVVWGLLPHFAALVLLTLPLYLIQIRLYRKPAESPLHYVKLTQTTFALSVIFGLLLMVGLLIG